MRRRFAALTEVGYPYLVAEIDGRWRAMPMPAPYRTRPAYRFTVENSSTSLRSPGPGVGTALLTSPGRCPTATGFRLMVAVIGDSRNRLRSRCTARAASRSVGTLHSVGFKFGRWLDSVLMQKALGDGASTTP